MASQLIHAIVQKDSLRLVFTIDGGGPFSEIVPLGTDAVAYVARRAQAWADADADRAALAAELPE